MQVDNQVLSPKILFANIHNMKVGITGTQKTVFVPIMVDHTEDPSNTMTEAFASPESDIKRCNFNLNDFEHCIINGSLA